MKKMIAGAAALALLGSASMALDSSREVYFQSGTHQFYVWCTGGAAGFGGIATTGLPCCEKALMNA